MNIIKFLLGAVRYDYRDEFITDLTGGNVHGTACEPGAGTRTVVDTDTPKKCSISGGKLNMAPHTTPAYGDPGFWINEAITRAAGLMLKGQVNISNVTPLSYFGFHQDKTGVPTNTSIRFGYSLLGSYELTVVQPSLYSISNSTDYELLLALRSTGAYYFIKDSGIWKLFWIRATSNTSTFYAGIGTYNATLTSDYLRIPSERWLPIPLASDGMSNASVSDGLGHNEQTGLGSGGSGLSYTDDGTWTVAAGKAVNTPTEGGELLTDGGLEAWTSATNLTSWSETISGTSTVNQETVTIHGGSNACRLDIDASNNNAGITQSGTIIGNWYLLSAWVKAASGTPVIKFGYSDGIGVNLTLDTTYTQRVVTSRATNTSVFFWRSSAASNSLYIDDISVKPLTLSSLFSSLSLSTQDVVASADLAVVAGTQAGMVICLDSAATPANFLLIYHNGVNLILEKCVAGTYTTLISAAATYSANAKAVIHKDGTEVRAYYNDVLIGTVQTVSDAGIIDNKLHGIFSTYSGNTIDNFNVYARGNQYQYSNIDRY